MLTELTENGENSEYIFLCIKLEFLYSEIQYFDCREKKAIKKQPTCLIIILEMKY